MEDLVSPAGADSRALISHSLRERDLARCSPRTWLAVHSAPDRKAICESAASPDASSQAGARIAGKRRTSWRAATAASDPAAKAVAPPPATAIGSPPCN